MFDVSYEMVIFKGHKVVNRGTCKNTNGLTDYSIIKTLEKGNKTYTIKEKYYGKEFYSKEYEIHDHNKFYVITSYSNPSTNTFWVYDTRKDN